MTHLFRVHKGDYRKEELFRWAEGEKSMTSSIIVTQSLQSITQCGVTLKRSKPGCHGDHGDTLN